MQSLILGWEWLADIFIFQALFLSQLHGALVFRLFWKGNRSDSDLLNISRRAMRSKLSLAVSFKFHCLNASISISSEMIISKNLQLAQCNLCCFPKDQIAKHGLVAMVSHCIASHLCILFPVAAVQESFQDHVWWHLHNLLLVTFGVCCLELRVCVVICSLETDITTLGS